MIAAVRLPDEVVLSILSHLDPFRIAGVEGVCRQWHSVSRSNTHLWQELDLIREDSRRSHKFSKASMGRCLDAVRARSGHHLRRLDIEMRIQYVHPYGPLLDVEDTKYITDMLPRLGLKVLRFALGVSTTTAESQDEEEDSDDEYEDSKSSSGSNDDDDGGDNDDDDDNDDHSKSSGDGDDGAIARIASPDIQKLVQVNKDVNDTLESMRISCLSCAELDAFLMEQTSAATPVQANFSFAGTPTASRQLQRLSMAFKCDIMFVGESLPTILRSATHVSLRFDDGHNFTRLLQNSTKDTLVCLDMTIFRSRSTATAAQSQDRETTPQRRPTYRLPNLRRLALTVQDALEAGCLPSWVDHELACDKLYRLSLTTPSPYLLLSTIMSDNGIQYLHLCSGGDARFDCTGVAELLHDRYATTLQKITIAGPLVQSLIDDLCRFPTMQLDEIDIIDSTLHGSTLLQSLRRLVQSRQRHQPLRHIRVNFQSDYEHDDDAVNEQWLRRHVDRMEVYREDAYWHELTMQAQRQVRWHISDDG